MFPFLAPYPFSSNLSLYCYSPFPLGHQQVILETLNQPPAAAAGSLFEDGGKGTSAKDDGVVCRLVLVAQTEDPRGRAKTAELLAKVKVHAVLHGQCQQAALAIADLQSRAGRGQPDVVSLTDAANLSEVMDRVTSAAARGGSCVALVTDPGAVASMICRALSLDLDRISSFRCARGSRCLITTSIHP